MNKNRIEEGDIKKLNKIFFEMDSAFADIDDEHTVFVNRSNQQAGKRARVASIKLTKLLKEYRRVSMRIGMKLPIKATVP